MVSKPDTTAILDRMTDAFFALDAERRFTYLNGSGREIICAAIGEDYSTEELQGRHIWEEIPDAVGTTFHEEYERALDSGETRSFEEYYDPLDTWFEVNAYPSDSGLSVYFQDVTERKRATQELERTVDALHDLYMVPSDTDRSFEDRCRQLLDLGRRRLDLPFAALTRLTETTQTIVASRGDHPLIAEGEQCPIEESYCRQLVDAEGTLAVYDAVEQGWESDPGYQLFELGSYIGGRVVVDGELYGSICFASDHPRSEAFTESERTFVKLAARWLGYELEQRKYRREAERQERRYRTLAQNKPGGAVFLFDEDRRYIIAAGRALEQVEVSGEAMEGRTLDEVFPPEIVEYHRPKYDAILDGDEVQWEQAYGGDHFRIRGAPLRDEHGEVHRGMLVAENITDRVERERRLRTLHDISKDLVSCERAAEVHETLLSGAVEVLASDISLVYVADGDRLVPGAVSKAVGDEDYFEEVPVETSETLLAEAYRTGDPGIVDDLRDEPVEPAEDRYRSSLTVPIGDYGVFQTVATEPGAFDEEDLDLVETLSSNARTNLDRLERERSLRERTEDLEQQNERLDEFVNIVTHDLRTPLTVATGRLDLVDDDCESPHIEEIRTAHERMEQLIDDLLAAAREGLYVTDVEPLSFRTVVETAWENFDTAGGSLTVEGDLTIPADRERLQQLLENLVRNAVEYGGDDVNVAAGPLDGADGFYLTDDGPGIPQESRDRIFEFGYTETEHGTGFGLAIVQQIANAHGWSVTATEGADGGARFEVTGVDVEP